MKDKRTCTKLRGRKICTKKYSTVNLSWHGLPVQYLPCTHQHFKVPTIDRKCIDRDQHINLLATPKGYRWSRNPYDNNCEKNQATLCKQQKRKCSTNSGVTDKFKLKYGGKNGLDRLWECPTPENIERLFNIMVDDLKLTNREANNFINEQKENAQNAQRMAMCRCCGDSDTQYAWIREFSDLIGCKLKNHVAAIMCSYRTRRQKKLMQLVLKCMSDISGECVNIASPETRTHKIMVLAADRIAIWLDNMLEESNKVIADELEEVESKRRQEEDEIRKKRQEEENRKKEEQRKINQEKQMEKMKEEERKKQEREEEQKRKREEMKKKKEEEDKVKKEDPMKKEDDRKVPDKKKEEKVGEKKEERKDEKKEVKKDDKEPKKPGIEHSKEERLNKPGPDKRKSRDDDKTKEDEDKRNKEKELRSKDDDRRNKEEEERKNREEDERKNKEKEERKRQEEKKKDAKKDTDRDQGEETDKDQGEDTFEEALVEEDVVQTHAEPTCIDPMEVIVDWINKTDKVETRRQTKIENVINETLYKELEKYGDVRGMEGAINNLSGKVSTWVDELAAEAEKEIKSRAQGRAKMFPASKGVLYHIKKDEDNYYKVRQISCSDISERKNRIDRPMKSNDVKDFTTWAEGLIQVSDAWTKWVENTFCEAYAMHKRNDSNTDLTDNEFNAWKERKQQEATEWKKTQKCIYNKARKWEDWAKYTKRRIGDANSKTN